MTRLKVLIEGAGAAGGHVTGFILRALISAIGLWIATRWVPGIRIDSAGSLVLAGILLGAVNAIVRPILIILTLPITILSLGMFLLVVNTAMVALVALILPGFHIYGGFSSAFADVAHRLDHRLARLSADRPARQD